MNRRTALKSLGAAMAAVVLGPIAITFGATRPKKKWFYHARTDGSRTHRILVDGREVAAQWADAYYGRTKIYLLKIFPDGIAGFYSSYGIDDGPPRPMSTIIRGNVDIIPGEPMESLMDMYRHQQEMGWTHDT